MCLRSAVKVFIFLFKSQSAHRYLRDDDVQIKRPCFILSSLSLLFAKKKKTKQKNKTTLSPIFECWISSLRRPPCRGRADIWKTKKQPCANVKERLNKQRAIRTITLPIFADCNLKIFACRCLRKRPPTPSRCPTALC